MFGVIEYERQRRAPTRRRYRTMHSTVLPRMSGTREWRRPPIGESNSCVDFETDFDRCNARMGLPNDACTAFTALGRPKKRVWRWIKCLYRMPTRDGDRHCRDDRVST